MREGLRDLSRAIFPDWVAVHPWDYIMHFAVSFAGVLIIYFVLWTIFKASSKTSFIWSVATLFFLGLFKEFYIDGIRPDILIDLAANFVGMGLACWLIKKFRS